MQECSEPEPPPTGRTVSGRGGGRLGTVTRGTTNPNRLRRVDRWLVAEHATLLRRSHRPLVVDLGYGAHPVTTFELFDRLRTVHPRVEVLGLELDPQRVALAARLAQRRPPGQRPDFALGGFEVPVADGRRPVLIRAFNVLRQYPPEQVPDAWAAMLARLAPDGVLVEGTCDELGRRATWVALTAADGPRSLTLSLRLADLERPSELAERLPKVLIHRNVPGEAVHTLLAALDRAWVRQAALAPFGVRQRWTAAVAALREEGWPVLGGPRRWRLGELGVAWTAVSPGPASPAPSGTPRWPGRRG